jgi:CDP-glucose 4,6-dehydratase
VIGCGDWAAERIVPDTMRALGRAEPIGVRNPVATRPWQHVLEPLSGYLCLAESLSAGASLADAFNFGPQLEANHSVRELVEEALRHWPGTGSTRLMQRPPMRPACSTCLADLVSLAATRTR